MKIPMKYHSHATVDSLIILDSVSRQLLVISVNLYLTLEQHTLDCKTNYTLACLIISQSRDNSN